MKNEDTAREQLILLLEHAAHREALLHMNDGELAMFRAALTDGALLANDWLEEDSLLLGSLQRAGELLEVMQQYRQRFDAFTPERTKIMIGKPPENKAFASPPTREQSPAYLAAAERVEELNKDCRAAYAAYAAAVAAANRARLDPSPEPAPDAVSSTVHMPGPSHADRVAAADEAVNAALRAMNAAGQARLKFLQSKPFPRPYPPHLERQRQDDVAAAKRRQQLAEDLQAIGTQR